MLTTAHRPVVSIIESVIAVRPRALPPRLPRPAPTAARNFAVTRETITLAVMKFEWFEVQGYKNIATPLRLTNLGPINIIHGDNNVGKSNLLESLGFFFVLLRTLAEDGPKLVERYELGVQKSTSEPGATIRTHGFFAERGFATDETFHYVEPAPITLRALITFADTECPSNAPSWVNNAVLLGLRAELLTNSVAIRLIEFQSADGTDLTHDTTNTGEKNVSSLRILFDVMNQQTGSLSRGPRYALIRADRSILSEAADAFVKPEPFTGREPLPADLAQALYDAEGGKDIAKKGQFKRFMDSLEVFRDIIGPGQWRMWYDRDTERFDLRLMVDNGYLPLRAMGSGIQQIVNLVARIVMSEADIVAIEEPELNLRYVAQLRFREILTRLTKEGLLKQVFLTSHSPAFEMAPMFHLLTRTPNGPNVELRNAEQAARFVNPDVELPPKDAKAPISYVTTEGLVRLPTNIREKLVLLNGGGVVFVEAKDGFIRMLTDDQFADLFESSEEPK